MNNLSSQVTQLAIAFSLCSAICNAQQSELTVKTTNFETTQGVAVINLFREQDDLPKKPFKTLTTRIQNGIAIFTFDALPSGDYAAIVYHDENANGTIDHKMGFPNEPMGFSNNWNLSLFSGMPTFRKLKFEHQGPATTIEIKVE